jgi:hypothetical protein
MPGRPLQFLLLLFAGWVNRKQLDVIDYLKEENRVLREQMRGRRLRFTDEQRRRLAVRGKVLGRSRLREVTSLLTPDTILRWYRQLIAEKYDGTAKRGPGRLRTAVSLREMLVRFAKENFGWGYTRLRGALRNLRHAAQPFRDQAQRVLYLAQHFGLLGYCTHRRPHFLAAHPASAETAPPSICASPGSTSTTPEARAMSDTATVAPESIAEWVDELAWQSPIARERAATLRACRPGKIVFQ